MILSLVSKKLSAQELDELLPWYLNGTLPADERRRVEAWLGSDPQAAARLAECRRLRRSVAGQPAAQPALAVQGRVIQRIQSGGVPRATNLWGGWLSGALLALSVLVLLWLAVRPGVRLQWSVPENSLASFRVYRAPQGSDRFALLSDIPARPGESSYSYVDPLPLPGRAYVYRVEGVLNPQGKLAFSESIVSSPLAALPGQLAVLFVSLAVAYSLVSLASLLPAGGLGQKGKPVQG